MIDPNELLIYGGGAWYNVNNITLMEAVSLSNTGVHAIEYTTVLDSGAFVNMEAAKLVIDIIKAYPLDISAIVETLYARYEALSAEEKASVG